MRLAEPLQERARRGPSLGVVSRGRAEPLALVQSPTIPAEALTKAGVALAVLAGLVAAWFGLVKPTIEDTVADEVAAQTVPVATVPGQPTDPGTDPNLTDSDFDGINDNLENNSGINNAFGLLLLLLLFWVYCLSYLMVFPQVMITTLMISSVIFERVACNPLPNVAIKISLLNFVVMVVKQQPILIVIQA